MLRGSACRNSLLLARGRGWNHIPPPPPALCFHPIKNLINKILLLPGKTGAKTPSNVQHVATHLAMCNMLLHT